MKILRLDKELPLPKYETQGSAGMDLYAAKDGWVTPGEILTMPTGIAIVLEPGYEAQIRPRSGLAAKDGITVVNSPGTIDSDYRGEIKVILHNNRNTDLVGILMGDRIAQFEISPVFDLHFEEVYELTDSERGEGGLGSTGT